MKPGEAFPAGSLTWDQWDMNAEASWAAQDAALGGQEVDTAAAPQQGKKGLALHFYSLGKRPCQGPSGLFLCWGDL